MSTWLGVADALARVAFLVAFCLGVGGLWMWRKR